MNVALTVVPNFHGLFCNSPLSKFSKCPELVLTALVIILVLAVVYDFFSLLRSKQHTFRTAFKQYLIIRVFRLFHGYIRKQLDKITKDVKSVQEALLLERLHESADTVYGKLFDFQNITTREEYRRVHPLTRYIDYQPYVDRIAAGEDMILTKKAPHILAASSGTSGKSSLIPMVKRQGLVFLIGGILQTMDTMLDVFQGARNLQKSLKLFYTPKERISEGGIPIGPGSSSPKSTKSMLDFYSTPLPAFDILTEREALYVHLLFGLKDQRLGFLEANFVAMVHTAFVELEKKWPKLVEDIELGRVNPDLNISPEVRDRLNAIMTPDPMRAAELKAEFNKGFTGIAKRIWPHLNLVLAVDSGSFDIYGKQMRRRYTKGITTYSPLYAATEGFIGVNLWPLEETRKYLLHPKAMFFEFIPIDNSYDEQPDTLFLDKVELGALYELVITSASGFYRYRFGDVVKVVDFYNACPVVEFMYRQGQLLNCRGERTPENSFYQALVTTAEKWEGIRLIDYCCAESVLLEGLGSSGQYPRYVIFLELQSDKGEPQLTEAQKTKLDVNLCQEIDMYGYSRIQGSIAAPDIHLVKPDTFQALRAFLIENTDASVNQFKVPRVLRMPMAVQFVMSRVLPKSD